MSIECMEDLQRLVAAGETNWRQYGEVNAQEWDGLILFDYRQEAQFENRWNWFERNSRGLILNRQTGEVVARPFEKFFNWFEHGRTPPHTAHMVAVHEKMDGSMGILYRHNHQWRIATRGSFTSSQALWATDYFNARWPNFSVWDSLWHTFIFEIIYPENRVVVDYGQREDLVLLAIRSLRTGEYISHYGTDVIAGLHGFARPGAFTFNSVTDILEVAGQIDANQEGWVAEFSDGSRWKFKGDRYRELHKLISGLSYRKVAEAMERNSLDALFAVIPDEFLDEARRWAAEIEAEVAGIETAVREAYELAPKDDQKTFALWVNEHHKPLASYLFLHHKGSPLRPLIFQKEF